LYSDLAQQKSANADGFAANASAWQAALTRAALAGQLPTEQKIIIQTSTQLLDALRSSQYGRPTGLGVVFDIAVQSGKLIDLKDFNTAEQSIYQKSWIPTPWSIIRWSLRQAGLMSRGSYDQEGGIRQGQLVVVVGLENLATHLQASIGPAVTDRIMAREAFAQLVSRSDIGSLTTNELDLLLRFLARDKRMLTYNADTVKFKAPTSERPEAISQEDSTIASIKSLIASLEVQISSLTSKVTALQNTAQAAVQSKNRHAALSALRSKKLAEANLQQRVGTLSQLEEVYAKIQQAVDQVQMVRVMQSSAETLKSLNRRVGGVDKVDEIMDDLRTQMGQVDDVRQIIAEPLDGKAVLDENELDDEFEALEKEEQARIGDVKADETRARLAELANAENVAKQKTADEANKKAQDDALEAELSSSAQKLEQIHLDDGSIHDNTWRKAGTQLPAE